MGLGLIAMVVLSTGNVISRYVFENALLWADEAVVFAMIVLVWLGGVVCAWDRSDLRMSLLVDRLPEGAARWLKVVQHLVVAGTCGLAAWLSFGFVRRVFNFGMSAEATGIPVWIVHSAVTISLSIITLIAVRHLATTLFGRRASGSEKGS